MSWFAKLRSKSVSTQNRPPTGVRSLYGKVMVDPQTCLEVFKNHWRQAYTIMCRHIPTAATIYHRVALTGDEVQAVVNYVDQMMNLLVEEETVNGKIGPMLQFLTNENIMEKLLDWSVEHRQFADEMKHEQLKVYETLLCGSPQPVLHQRHILNPLLRLLGMCSDATTLEIENHLILLLNQLCVSLYKDPSLLEQFFNAKADHGPAKFLIFSLLIPYVHREGRIGQQARDALLLCMSLSAENETVGTYIAENSNFCHVLATGLSGLYSSLPRKIEIRSDDWHALRKEDYVNAPALLMFLNSLEFCNAVAQVAHPMVRNQLLELLYNGFLVPVMGPALHKTSVDEVIASTTYFDLFLRTITEPALMKAFLRFITTAKYDDHLVMDSLISRITSNSRISVVTLALFRTVISLNCEDVMLELVLKYLVPCTHVMVSQRRSVKEADLYGKTSEKFLSLTPNCCRIDNNANQQATPVAMVTNIGVKGKKTTPVTTVDQKVAEQKEKEKADLRRFETSYMEYLQDARVGIGQSWKACKCWSAPYDGDNPAEDSVKAEDLHWGQIKNYDRKERVVYGTSRGRSASFHPRSPSEGVETRPRLASAPVKSRQADETQDSGLSSGSDTKPDNEWSVSFKGGRIEAHSPSKTRRKISPTTSSSDSLHSIHSIVDVEIHVDGAKTDDKPTEKVPVNGETEGTKEEQERRDSKSKDDKEKIVGTKEEQERRESKTEDNTEEVVQKGKDEESDRGQSLRHGTSSGSSRQSGALANGAGTLHEVRHGCGGIAGERVGGSGRASGETCSRTHAAAQNGSCGGETGNVHGAREVAANRNAQETQHAESSLHGMAGDTSNTDHTATNTLQRSDSFEALFNALETKPIDGELDLDMSIENLLNRDVEGKILPPELRTKRSYTSISSLHTNNNLTNDRVVHICKSCCDDDEGDNEVFDQLDEKDGKEKKEAEDEEEEDEAVSLATTPSPGMSPPQTPHAELPQSPSNFRPLHLAFSPIAAQEDKSRIGSPNTGPFLAALFSKLETMMSNSLYVNLLLTGILRQLSYYPLPLLRSFLLNTNLVFQPSVKSLVQILSSVKNKVDYYSQTVENFQGLVVRGRNFLSYREQVLYDSESNQMILRDKKQAAGQTPSPQTTPPQPQPAKPQPPPPVAPPKRRSTFGSFFSGGRSKTPQPGAAAVPRVHYQSQRQNRPPPQPPAPQPPAGSAQQVGYSLQESHQTRNAVYCAIILTEFVKELSAIVQEHAVTPPLLLEEITDASATDIDHEVFGKAASELDAGEDTRARDSVREEEVEVHEIPVTTV
ncbi:PREDICTED: FTS and Hook-interacting protein-like isoform X4 [Branchiostoma belcheri]|uniref:FTS and Hook-interacting protein-like isoform X1 n=1 Tax=Branchiostoma belcheri TaxID=7741 RepID=A0A6P5A2F7_BRABE|nr:PREDICTED: FTS and Hook-interacting protein-like isoform X1 [Branchiostoma belcheri]XP_019647471.1 PREDICTED: FTS and Hook-interacting protein-like isoform X2 [Branchiostoma belcheri]XP_019647474.1 PREDICTED: FTS and Hook-interacting protein-like isoform X4 [Branchiostoma belcheri]